MCTFQCNGKGGSVLLQFQFYRKIEPSFCNGATRAFHTKIGLIFDPGNEIFHAITSEVSKLRHFVNFMYCQKTKITIFINFRVI